ncbi:MAG: hypothetical protein KAT15_06135, partial [Bacteroidales bacterium]|nr:hypothetical protein [Bacteroidales bacterium]
MNRRIEVIAFLWAIACQILAQSPTQPVEPILQNKKDATTLRIAFAGDIMGHDSQIAAARV